MVAGRIGQMVAEHVAKIIDEAIADLVGIRLVDDDEEWAARAARSWPDRHRDRARDGEDALVGGA